jgi:hypothetical protein
MRGRWHGVWAGLVTILWLGGCASGGGGNNVAGEARHAGTNFVFPEKLEGVPRDAVFRDERGRVHGAGYMDEVILTPIMFSIVEAPGDLSVEDGNFLRVASMLDVPFAEEMVLPEGVERLSVSDPPPPAVGPEVVSIWEERRTFDGDGQPFEVQLIIVAFTTELPAATGQDKRFFLDTRAGHPAVMGETGARQIRRLIDALLAANAGD